MAKGKKFHFIVKMIHPVFWSTIYSMFLGALTILSAVGLIGTSTYLISLAAQQPSIAELQVSIVGVRFFGLARSIFRYLERVASHSVNLRMVSGLRLWFYKKLEKLIPARTSLYTSGDLTTRALQDLESLDQVFIRVIAPPLIAVFVVIVTSLVLFSMQAQLGLFSLFSMAIIGGVIFFLSIIIQEHYLKGFVTSRSNLYAFMGSMVEGIADIRINSNGKAVSDRFFTIRKKFGDSQKRSIYANAILNSLQPIASAAGMIIIFLTAAGLVEKQILDPILVGVSALLVMAGCEAFQSFPQVGSTLSQIDQSLDRIIDIVDQDPEIIDPEFPAVLSTFRSLNIEKLVFQYPGNRGCVFDGLSLEITAGKKLALVGASGAGKSSLINILLRYWEYSSGSIRINGTELKDISSIDIRNLIRASSQNPFFFPMSLRENLLLATPDVTEGDMKQVLEITQCLEWVYQLPQRLDTFIGDRGVRLSEGQRKRLDVARALIGKPELIILDEPFAGIDYPLEVKMKAALFEAYPVMTMVLITHHLVDLEMYDEILFMEKGRIIEKGDYHSLLNSNGKFAKMHDMQKNIIPNQV